MEKNSCRMVTDAVPSCLLFNKDLIPRKIKRNDTFNTLLDQFSIDDYKSVLFLLMDHIGGLDEFLSLAKKDQTHLKIRIQKMKLKEKIIIELLGTMKRYQDLRCLGTCKHIFLSEEEEFDEIGEIWKVLYALCEEVTDSDLKFMIQYIPDNFTNQVSSAEEWFCYALKYGIIEKTDLSGVKDIFKENPECLNIINNFKGPEIKRYHIKTPALHSPCGIALIFNFETFSEASKLETREDSEVDIALLENLWETFGFETHVYKDLDSSKVMQVLKDFAVKDHSKFDAFVCCILSHGESSVIYASDGVAISISKLISTVSENCISLNEKPKLFFFQACQGTIIYQGLGKPEFDMNNVQDASSDNLTPQKIELNGLDVYAVVSTIDRCVSFRHPLTGGLFVQTLCSVMLECGHKESLLDVITQVTAKVSKISVDLGSDMPVSAKQIVPSYSTLKKKLILKKRVQ